MNQAEQRKAAKDFAAFWQGKGDEVSDTQLFWISLLRDVLGESHPGQAIQFEKRVKLENTSFIDGYMPSTRVLIEQKSLTKSLTEKIPQSDGSKLTPFEQAKRYSNELPYDERPRWIVTCNFAEFHIHDMNQPKAEPEILLLKDLEKEYHRLGFLTDRDNANVQKEADITAYTLKAGEMVGKLYDALLAQYLTTRGEDKKDDPDLLSALNRLCVRLVFCLYAEDAGIFGKKNQFYDYLNVRRKTGRDALKNLFRILDIPENERVPDEDEDLLAFPYVNGGLFADAVSDSIPRLDESVISLLLDDASISFEWSGISPTIFGAVFESTLNQETRRQGGMHYTSITNIHRVTEPLFLNELRNELAEIKTYKAPNKIEQLCNAFRDKLSKLTFLDPACGSGNFLTQTYLDLRELENDALRFQLESKGRQGQQSFDIEGMNPISVQISQFYGIEINDFAVSVAKTALWIAESQMMQKTEDIVQVTLDFLPLKSYNNISEGNALREDWQALVPKEKLNYIMGNPPFIGYAYQSKEQKADLQQIYSQAKNIDYVAGWYFKSAELMQKSDIRAALVSTNSICQGEQVEVIWRPLMEQYGVHIDFAYRPFIWDSDAKNKAHVHCVIVGFSCGNPYREKVIFDGSKQQTAKNINPYLIDAPTAFIAKRTKPFCSVSPMHRGSQPTDDGNLILTLEEKEQLVKAAPEVAAFIRPYMMGKDFINRKPRYCLWLVNADPAVLKCPEVKERIRRVREFRLNSRKEATKKKAETPMLFDENQQPNTNFIALPSVSSENRRYIPIDFMTPETVVGNKIYIVENASTYEFGVMTSSVHMAWMKAITGRLKSDFNYSITVVYNNFIWPDVTEEQKAKIAMTAQGILDARNQYPESSLDDLYDELTMPSDLRKAHQANDQAVMEAYGFSSRMTEPEIIAELMKLYQVKEREEELKMQQKVGTKKGKTLKK